MPSSAELNRAQFADQFNKLLGNKLGRPIQTYTDKSFQNSISEADRAKAAIALATVLKAKAPAAAKTPKAKKTPAVGTLSTSDLLNSNSPQKTPTAPKIVLPTPKIPLDKNAKPSNIKKVEGVLGNILSGGIPSVHGAVNAVKHGIGNVADYVGIIDRQDPSGTVGATAQFLNTGGPTQTALQGVARVTDVAERPMYAAMEASRQLGNNPTNVSGALHGALEGVTGRQKTGFGQVIEATPAAHLNPWVKRGLGLAGDIGLDPLTYIGGGSEVAGKEATAAGLRAGTEATGENAIKEEFGKVAKDALQSTANSGLKDLKKITKVGEKATPLEDVIVKKAQDKLDNMVFDEKSGKMIGGKAADTHGTFASAVGESARDEMINSISNTRNKFVARIGAGGRYTAAELAKLRENPLMAKWLDAAREITDERTAAGVSAKDPQELAKAIDKRFAAKLTPAVDEITAKTLAGLDDAVMRIPKVSFANHDLYMPRVGRALNDLKNSVPKNSMLTSGLNNFKKTFLMSSWLPGYTSHISQKMRSINKIAFDEFKAGMEDTFRGTTKAERETIHHAIEQGRELTGDLGDIQKKVQEAYHTMYYDEVKSGVRSAGKTPYANNYVFNKIEGGTGNLPHDLNTDWREPRKAAIKSHKGSTSGFTSLDAKDAGLRVQTDAANAVVDRKMRSLNKQAKAFLSRDLATHYGIASSIPMNEALSKDLVRLDPKIHPWLKDELKPGQQMYLHKDINDVIKKYNKLMGFGMTPEAGNGMKTFENLTKIFKQANTIYWPGFHMRNIVSDAFMGMLDGVRAKEYPEIFSKMLNKEGSTIKIGGETVPFHKLYDSYVKNASSGFIDSEMHIRTPKTDLNTTGFMDSVRPGHITSRLRDASQVREDFGRLVHYYHAMDEEYAHQIAKGVSKDTAWKNAEEAAISRVNRFKFDYSALTPAEQKIRKYGIPFYTYMRKAAPVLLENLLMKPRYFSYINKLQRALAPTQDFKANREPSWMNNQNFSQLTDNSQPWGFTDALFPTRTLTDAIRNPVETFNPLIQAGFELKFGKDTFTGKPVHNIGDILKNKWKGTTQWENAMAPTDPNVKGSKPTLEKWATALGIPLYKVTAARQEGRQKELEFQLKQKVIGYNKQIEKQGYKISIRHGVIYLIVPKTATSKEQIVGQYQRFSDIPLTLH